MARKSLRRALESSLESSLGLHNHRRVGVSVVSLMMMSMDLILLVDSPITGAAVLSLCSLVAK